MFGSEGRGNIEAEWRDVGNFLPPLTFVRETRYLAGGASGIHT